MSFHHIQQTERMRLPLSCPRQPIGDVRKPTQSRPSGNRLWSGVSGNQGTSQESNQRYPMCTSEPAWERLGNWGRHALLQMRPNTGG